MKKFHQTEETMIVLAARYAHTRNTSAPYFVVQYILSHWESISDLTKKQLKEEAKSFAVYCDDDWQRLIDKN